LTQVCAVHATAVPAAAPWQSVLQSSPPQLAPLQDPSPPHWSEPPFAATA
jgi:hypothetical protein